MQVTLRPASCLVEELKIFAGLEADGFAGGDGDFGAGAGVAADAGFAGLDGEDAEAAEFDAVACAQGLLHGFEDGVHGGFCLGARKAGAFNDPLDEVLLDQWVSPSCAESERGVRWCRDVVQPTLRW